MKTKFKTHNKSHAGVFYFRVILLLGYVCFAVIPMTYGADTLSKIKPTQQQPSDDRTEVYRNPSYFKNIRVEQQSPSSATSENAQASFERINAKYQSHEFNYQENRANRLSWWERIQETINEFFKSLFPNLSWHADVTLYYVLIGIGLLGLLFVIYKLTASGKKRHFYGSEQEELNSPDWIEKRLTEINLETFLEKALAEKDYILAIRYLHLINLKKLALNDQIDWHYQKTNHELLQEIKNRDLSSDFAHTIRIYEYIWYGRFAIDETQYQQYQQVFQQLNREIA